MPRTAAALLPASDLMEEEYWRETWRVLRRGSFLKSSQDADPRAWRRFYDRVSSSYLELWGYGGELGRRVSGLLVSQGLAGPGKRVLDVGCGPGTLSLPLAQAGAEVIALDWSPAMLARLEREAGYLGDAAPRTVCAAWADYTPGRPADLVLASFFPEAFSIAGLRRLESQGRGQVALVMGDGRDCFGICRELWTRVLDEPYPKGGFHLSCVLGWLMASGRRPNLTHLAWNSSLDLSLETMIGFYTDYFAIFGRQGLDVEHAVRDGLEQWRERDRVRARGEVGLSVVWWDAPDRAGRAGAGKE